mmetsp:Transcript_19393/g.28727  ORF Transcript_19393/g.28727 Transcript_19393/m.28727 type:complete len:576 (+) Transcript_19393:42-1769(+)
MGKKLRTGNLPLDGKSRKMTTADSRPVLACDLPLEGSSLEKLHLSVEVSLCSRESQSGENLEEGNGSDNSVVTNVEPKSSASSKCVLVGKSITFCSVVIGVVTFAVIFTIVFSQLNNVPDNRSPTVEEVKAWVLSNNYSSRQDLSDPNTPQFMAAKFMSSGPYGILSSNNEAASKWKERYALSVFYYATNGPKWKVLFEFHRKTLPTCEWFQNVNIDHGGVAAIGASCSSGRVDTLRLVNQGLEGTIPTEIALLEELRILDLQHNNIRGTLPSEMQQLTELRKFDCISCTNLDGSLPSWIGKLTLMKTLGLTENKFEGSIPKDFGKLTDLINLALDNNLLTGDLTVLNDMGSLRNLYLEENGFTGTVGEAFFENLDNLETLDLSDNNLVGRVPINLFSNGKLRILDVHDNLINDFPDSIVEMQETNLEFLAIHGNPIENEGFPSTIIFLTNLAHLDATSIQIRGKMPDFLGDLTKLTYLFLADTTFEPGSIPESYQKLTNLKDFSVKDSARSGNIPAWFSKLSKLILLDLDSNKLAGPLPEALPENLKFLLINRNLLTGTIPAGLINSTLSKFQL